MRFKQPPLLLILAVGAGCATSPDIAGTYAPSCVAFEGDTITLSDGTFTWDKFTDEVTVDDAGNTVDPFPGFPVRGTYSIEGAVVHLETAVGELAARLHLVQRPGQVYLLTAGEFAAWQQDGTVPDCALLLGAGE
jgi:hypothetical protein